MMFGHSHGIKFLLALGPAAMTLAVPIGVDATSVPTSSGDNPFADLGLPEIAITMTGDAFVGVPSELEAGRYVVALTNETEADAPEVESSGVAFLQAPGGMTGAELVETVASLGAPSDTGAAMDTAVTGDSSAMMPEGTELAEGTSVDDSGPADAAGEQPPEWYYDVTMAGGPYAFPGETAYAVVELTAGEWIAWAENPFAAQAPVPLTITAEAAPDQSTPAADVTVEMSEYAFAFEPELAAGTHVVEVANVGDQPHFLFLASVPDGTTVDDALALFATFSDPSATEPPNLSFEDATEVLSTGDQSAGVTAWYTLDVAAGTYLAMCFVPDVDTGEPHAMLGMTQIVIVA